MLSHVLPPGVLAADKEAGVHRMAEYIALFHAPWFLQAMVPASSPRLDLQLWKDMCSYQVN